MKPPQHTCSEGCPIQPDATGVTGYCLAHGMLRAIGRVTTERSVVVTRPQSEPKCEWCGNIFDLCSNASGITVWLLNKYSKFSNDNAVRPAYTRRTFWFYPRPLR